MRFIHLSDLHFSRERFDSFKNFYLDTLLKDLIKWHEEKKIDLIFITGDLVDKGGEAFSTGENYYKLIEKEILLKITAALNIEKSKLIIIPGNHDVKEQSIDEISESGLLHLSSIENVNKFIDSHLTIYHDGINRIQYYKEFEKEFYSDFENKQLTNFESCFIHDIDGIKIGIAAFNSAWRFSKELPKDKLLLGTSQIIRANKYFTEQCTNINIGLIHHPIELFSEIERHEINSFLQILNFDFLFCGHTHSTEVIHTRGTMGRIFISVAKSAFNNPREPIEKHKPGYSIADLEFPDDTKIEITCNFRKYVHDRISFDKDVETSEDGIYRDLLTSKSQTDDFRKYFSLTNKTCKAKQDGINTTLVIHGTDSIAPRDLSSIFVLPKLSEKPVLISDVEEDIYLFNIDDLLRDSRKFIIIGDKETGKSTLLNKIYIEASNSYSKYQLIPVEIDFNDLHKKDIKALIKDFLNEPDSSEIEKLLNDGKILLLLDNFHENGDTIHAKNKLKRFIDNYAKNKIILTTSESIDALLTVENSLLSIKREEERIKEFIPVFIGSVGVKEFKELAIKWFKNRDSEWIQNNLEKLIKVFEILRIPRTFFSVSLFLWIIEKQENFKPVNKANLVQQFLTYILEGLKIENAKAGSYNFDKKIELLTEIAFEMYENGNTEFNYSLTEIDVIKCIQKNFNLNQLMRLSPSEKLNEFIEKGILKKDTLNCCIHFRYEAFFQYFLSLNIDRNPDFKKVVYSEDEFLSFIDELDYYTGRKRDDFETLEIVIDRLKKAYNEIDRFINKNIDEYFPKESFFLKHIKTDKFISETRKQKLNDEEIEDALDKQLSMLPVDASIRAKESLDFKKTFYKVLELAARVLKNSENIQSPEYVNDALDLIINKAAKYGIYLQSIILSHLIKNKDEELPLPPEFFISIAPIINQLMLLNWLGTDFLEIPIEKKLKKHIKDSDTAYSEYELYLTAFIYSDMKFPDYIDYLDSVVAKIKNKFIAELCFMKIFLYYMFRPVGSSLLPRFERQMCQLLVKSRGLNKKKAKDFVTGTLRKKKEEAMQQLKLDL